jgi:hypothetical protein
MNKKNILYLGPYQQPNYVGQAALRNIHELSQVEHLNIIAKHIPVDSNDTFDTGSILLNTASSLDGVGQLDGVIQNLPIDFLAINYYAPNIVIPFVSPYIQYTNTDILSHYASVLVDDIKIKEQLQNKNTNVEIYEQQSPLILNQCHKERYNIGSYDHLYKFGFIGLYSKESGVIHKLIQAFLTTFRANDDVSLCILITATDKEKSELESFYADIKQSLKITNYDKIIFMFNNCNHMDSIRFLNNLNCYLSLNAYTKYVMYEKYCKQNNIAYVTHKDVSYTQMPIIPILSIDDIQLKQNSLTTESISKTLLQSVNDTSVHRSKNTNKSLSDLVCKIIQ